MIVPKWSRQAKEISMPNREGSSPHRNSVSPRDRDRRAPNRQCTYLSVDGQLEPRADGLDAPGRALWSRNSHPGVDESWTYHFLLIRPARTSRRRHCVTTTSEQFGVARSRFLRWSVGPFAVALPLWWLLCFNHFIWWEVAAHRSGGTVPSFDPHATFTKNPRSMSSRRVSASWP